MKRKFRLTAEEYAALASDEARADYVQQGDVYVLDVDGAPDTTGLEATLKKLRAREKELDAKLKAFDGVDPEQYRTLLEEKDKLEQERALKGASEEERLAILLKPERDRYQSDRQAWEKEKAKILAERDAANQSYRRHRIKSELLAAARDAKVKSQFHDDLELRVDLFDLVDDNVVAVETIDGERQPRRSPKDSMRHMTPIEFIETDIAKLKPDWFEPAAGGGAGGGGRPAARAGVISRTDQAGFLANVGRIANGEVQVG